MNRLGSNEDGSFSFLDMLTIISFLVGLQNLDLNITQENLDEQTADLKAQVDADVQKVLTDLQEHLQNQDKKIDVILGIMKENGGIIDER